MTREELKKKIESLIAAESCCGIFRERKSSGVGGCCPGGREKRREVLYLPGMHRGRLASGSSG